MFDLLKNKLGLFSKKLKEKEIVQTEESFSESNQEKVKPIELIEKESVFENESVEEVGKKVVFENKPFEEKVVKAQDVSRDLKADISFSSKVKGLITGKIELKEADLEDLLFELELSLLEADVSEESSQKIVELIKSELVGKKVNKKDFDIFINNSIKKILTNLISIESPSMLSIVQKSEKPFKILLLGPNGAGKTTTVAKLVNFFQKNSLTCILAASDTFRAASIEQLEKHAFNLNVRLIKHQYGSDPSAVAFDAVKAAVAKKIDVVLIDSAGRQDTNKNLIEELKKMQRVIKPDLKIFVGESQTGKSLLNQAKAFDEAVSLNGFILTKIDVDTKGGIIISLLSELCKPVFFVGTGQNYEDFEEFSPNFLINKIL